MITAHSGCDRTQDNSLDFIQHALNLSVDAIEVDVRKDSKGKLILSHDETQEEAVSLEQAFIMLKEHPEKRMNCDLKQTDLEGDVVALAQKCGVEKQLIFTGTVNAELFRKGEVRYPDVIWFWTNRFLPGYKAENQSDLTEKEEIEGMEQVLETISDYETLGVNWYYKDTEKVWEKAKALGVGISVWTVDEPEVQKIWFSRQVENITTRCATQMIQIRDTISDK